MCERTVTIPLEEYEDLKARIDTEESGYYEKVDNYEGFNLVRKYKFYEEIPDPENTEWGKEMINKVKVMTEMLSSCSPTRYIQKIEYIENKKLNKNWIRKIFKVI